MYIIMLRICFISIEIVPSGVSRRVRCFVKHLRTVAINFQASL